jgi:hypothetical protein
MSPFRKVAVKTNINGVLRSSAGQMKADGGGLPRTDTDASLHVERQNTDRELARRVTTGDADANADAVLSLARDRADRLLEIPRAAADARLPLAEQTQIAVELLLGQREREDRTVRTEREHDDARLDRERSEQREKLVTL